MKYGINVEQLLPKRFSKTTIGLSLAGFATLGNQYKPLPSILMEHQYIFYFFFHEQLSDQLLKEQIIQSFITMNLKETLDSTLQNLKKKVQAQEKIPSDQSLGLIAINKKPPGLVNFGNTCFVNSVLQALASMPQFIKNLEELCQYDQIKEFKLKNGNGKMDNSKIIENKRKKQNEELGIKENSHLICKELLNILHGHNDKFYANNNSTQ